jgi:hypothetical protein
MMFYFHKGTVSRDFLPLVYPSTEPVNPPNNTQSRYQHGPDIARYSSTKHDPRVAPLIRFLWNGPL